MPRRARFQASGSRDACITSRRRNPGSSWGQADAHLWAEGTWLWAQWAHVSLGESEDPGFLWDPPWSVDDTHAGLCKCTPTPTTPADHPGGAEASPVCSFHKHLRSSDMPGTECPPQPGTILSTNSRPGSFHKEEADVRARGHTERASRSVRSPHS